MAIAHWRDKEVNCFERNPNGAEAATDKCWCR